MCTLLHVRPPRVGSLFPPVLSKSCNQFPLGFKVWFSINSSSRCWTPRLGSLTWGSEPSLQCVDFCGVSVRQSVSHPPTSYGIWFYSDCAPPTVSLWLLLCLWMWGIFFGELQRLPVDDCPAASCDSGVLARGSESTSFYSAILVPPPRTFLSETGILPENERYSEYKYNLVPLLWVLLRHQQFYPLLYLNLQHICQNGGKSK